MVCSSYSNLKEGEGVLPTHFQAMLEGAKVCMFSLVVYWQQIFIWNMFAKSRAQNWLGASHHTNLWWGVRETLRLCETCLTGLIPTLRFTDNRLRRLFFFFCQLYANTLANLPLPVTQKFCSLWVRKCLSMFPCKLCCAVSHPMQVMLAALKSVALSSGLC